MEALFGILAVLTSLAGAVAGGVGVARDSRPLCWAAAFLLTAGVLAMGLVATT